MLFAELLSTFELVINVYREIELQAGLMKLGIDHPYSRGVRLAELLLLLLLLLFFGKWCEIDKIFGQDSEWIK